MRLAGILQKRPVVCYSRSCTFRSIEAPRERRRALEGKSAPSLLEKPIISMRLAGRNAIYRPVKYATTAASPLSAASLLFDGLTRLAKQ